MLWIRRGRLPNPWWLVLASVKALRFAPTSWLTALMQAPRKLHSSYGDRFLRRPLSRFLRFQVIADNGGPFPQRQSPLQ